ncbi:universal stress protein [Cyanobacteria bacterium FACHB-63]|nr:universal stress protein [Cyanobacteria bacterium FACHB-63]
MLVRLQGTLGRTDLVQKMVLIPAKAPSGAAESGINLVVGYSNSPRSQTALDLTLWIAHQTRLATGKQVTVQVVYVVEDGMMKRIPVFESGAKRKAEVKAEGEWRTSRTAIAELETATKTQFGAAELFEQADRILWNARCMAEEWRGSLKTHLRFGVVAKELKEVVAAENASLLILGCDAPDHPLVKQLGKSFPCPVLGIPSVLEGE